MKQFTLVELQQQLEQRGIEATIINNNVGKDEVILTHVSSYELATANAICFVNHHKFIDVAKNCGASTLIVNQKIAKEFNNKALIIVNNPYLAYAYVAQIFDTTPIPPKGVHPSALISNNVKLGNNVSIGPFAYIAPGVTIGDNSIIESHCSIGDNCKIGNNCWLHPHVVLYHNVNIGQYVHIHSHTVIGSDGFGYAPQTGKDQQSATKWIKIPQLGGVEIGDYSEIGSSTTIDRGTLNNTIIGKNVIIDNQIHIAHNVQIGDGTAMAGGTLVAGSTQIGKNTKIAGASVIVDHIKIADQTFITAMSFVTNSITDSSVPYSSGMPIQDNASWKKSVALLRFKHQQKLNKRVSELEQQILTLKS